MLILPLPSLASSGYGIGLPGLSRLYLFTAPQAVYCGKFCSSDKPILLHDTSLCLCLQEDKQGFTVTEAILSHDDQVRLECPHELQN